MNIDCSGERRNDGWHWQGMLNRGINRDANEIQIRILGERCLAESCQTWVDCTRRYWDWYLKNSLKVGLWWTSPYILLFSWYFYCHHSWSSWVSLMYTSIWCRFTEIFAETETVRLLAWTSFYAKEQFYALL
jgi:hypothetical protein